MNTFTTILAILVALYGSLTCKPRFIFRWARKLAMPIRTGRL